MRCTAVVRDLEVEATVAHAGPCEAPRKCGRIAQWICTSVACNVFMAVGYDVDMQT